MGFLSKIGGGRERAAAADAGAAESMPSSNQPIKEGGYYTNPATRPGNDASQINAPSNLKDSQRGSSFMQSWKNNAPGRGPGSDEWQGNYQPMQINSGVASQSPQFDELMTYLKGGGGGVR